MAQRELRVPELRSWHRRAPLVILLGMSDVTRILSQIEGGDPRAAEELLPLVYEELRKLASAKLAMEKPGQTLQATALVHEAYLRLVGGAGARIQEPGARQTESDDNNLASGPRPLAPSFDGRGHFFAAAAESMRRILVDEARKKGRQKRSGNHRRFNIDTLDVAVQATPDQVLAIDEALEKLERVAPDVFELVKLRYFAGFNIEEAALALGISAPTAYRHWNYARAWLHAELLNTSGS